MNTFLSVLMLIINKLFGVEDSTEVAARVTATLETLNSQGVKIVIPNVAFLNGDVALRMLRQGAIPISVQGHVCPNTIVGSGAFTGGLSRPKGDGIPLPSLTGFAIAFFKMQKRVVFSRLTLFNKGSKEKRSFDLRIQTNVMFPVEGTDMDWGDPIKISIGIFDPQGVSNVMQLAMAYDKIVNWVVVAQAQLEQYIDDDGEWGRASESSGGAVDDKKNVLTGVPVAPWILNSRSHILWLCPPDCEYVKDAISREMKMQHLPVVFEGAEVEIETPKKKAMDFGGVTIE